MSSSLELPPTLARLVTATNNHDLDGLVACFAADYALEMPNHPTRNFTGPAQVRRNWEQFFALIPDITVKITDAAPGAGGRWWTEWEMRGTRLDGDEHLMRGVMITTVGLADGDLIRANRFYVEPTDPNGSAPGIDSAIASMVTGRPS